MQSTYIGHLTTQPSQLLLFLLLPSCLGLLFLLKHTFYLLRWVYATFFRSHKDLKRYGQWALITGATDGIGKAFAYQLALDHGLNLILVSRDPIKLNAVSSDIQSTFPNIKTKTLVFDFTSCNYGGFGVIEEAVKGVDVGVLINNVGITYPKANYFDELEEKVWKDIVRVNLEGTTGVIRAVLPGMIERKRGAVVSIGSGAAIVVPSHPLYTIYAATKAYIDQLSRCLYIEYKHCGIDVQCQVPLYVATKMASNVAFIEGPSLFVPSPEEYARAAMSRVGYEPRCIPYWAHAVQSFLAQLVPEPILDGWRLSIGIRRRGSDKLGPLDLQVK
ncbi:very-long-chain 3-oxoacyl-CoA reductase-like protein [Tripterygium wilfordii]|uniref:Very-long-chain 3-oxoacyl-CoA reductase-like protein n=1 Tax=Tripterygium wilfordii TaxID=458696 RepID=A0A7J7DKB6_TRIWF|nr:very-long-chain 3-oxoacyl-CoA reductase-like protein At1g24470 [Tripterygium wilfordii]KAF5746516.1 very-long-chain 3-oxoacyl-CoA reductase-like protein [Tripterygium wilfordii]